MESTSGSSSVIRSVQRAFDLLERVAKHPEGRRLSELADGANLSRSTAHNILASLEALGYVTQDGRGAPYRLTGKLAGLLGPHAEAEQELRARIRPVLQQLATDTGETAYLAFAAGDEYLCADASQSDKPLHLTVTPGEREPLLGTAIGHALLAADGELRDAVRNRLPADWEANAAEIARVERDGFALDLDAYHPGVSCVAVAITPRAAIGVAGPTIRLTEQRLAAIADQIHRAAARA